MNYTKGEWKVYQTDVKPDRWMVCAGDTGDKGIVKTVLDNSISPAEKLANASLIAQAPELYEALKKAHTLITSIIPNDLVSESAKHTMQKLIVKALAKVES